MMGPTNIQNVCIVPALLILLRFSSTDITINTQRQILVKVIVSVEKAIFCNE